MVGLTVGAAVGELVGLIVGTAVGNSVGLTVGGTIGLKVGPGVGLAVGLKVGAAVGGVLGLTVGEIVGSYVGINVGFAVSQPTTHTTFSSECSEFCGSYVSGAATSKSIQSARSPPHVISGGSGQNAVGVYVGEYVGNAVGVYVGEYVGDSVLAMLQHSVSDASPSQFVALAVHVAVQHSASSFPLESNTAVCGRNCVDTVSSPPSITLLLLLPVLYRCRPFVPLSEKVAKVGGREGAAVPQVNVHEISSTSLPVLKRLLLLKVGVPTLVRGNDAQSFAGTSNWFDPKPLVSNSTPCTLNFVVGLYRPRTSGPPRQNSILVKTSLPDVATAAVVKGESNSIS